MQVGAMTNREIDAEVATRIMGWIDRGDWMKRPDGVNFHKPSQMGTHILPHYSTDISAAWSVVEKMKGLKFWPAVELWPGEGGELWLAVFEGSGNARYSVKAPTAQEAICRAALRAMST